jgi:hypothetical protein
MCVSFQSATKQPKLVTRETIPIRIWPWLGRTALKVRFGIFWLLMFGLVMLSCDALGIAGRLGLDMGPKGCQKCKGRRREMLVDKSIRAIKVDLEERIYTLNRTGHILP